jgi:hypothetical protein
MIIRPYPWTARPCVHIVHEVRSVHVVHPETHTGHWHTAAQMLQSKALEHQQDV